MPARTAVDVPHIECAERPAETLAFGEEGTGVVLTTDREAYYTTDGGKSWSVGALPEGYMPLAMDAVP